MLQLRSSTSASCPLIPLSGLLPNTGMTLTGVLAAAAEGEGPAEPFFFGVEEGAGGGAVRERGGESGLEETEGESLGWEEEGGKEVRARECRPSRERPKTKRVEEEEEVALCCCRG